MKNAPAYHENVVAIIIICSLVKYMLIGFQDEGNLQSSPIFYTIYNHTNEKLWAILTGHKLLKLQTFYL